MRRLALLLLLTVSAFAEPGKQVAMPAPEGGVPYWLYVPAGSPPKDGWPLLLFLHGSGERGADLDKVRVHGPPKLVERTPLIQQFVVVSPQAPLRADKIRRFKNSWIKAVLDQVIADQAVNRDRLCITGLSMGGFATWAMLDEYPELFAAAAPVCGRGDDLDGKGKQVEVEKFAHLPIWVFHGDEDKAVPVQASRELVAALQNAGAKRVRYTEYNHVGHASWNPAYSTTELYTWMLAQRRGR